MILIVNNSITNDIKNTKAIEATVETRTFEMYATTHITNLHSRDLSRYEKIILSGSPTGEMVESYEVLYRDLSECGIPVLGICAGHQLLALANGAKLIKYDEKEIGNHRVYVTKIDDIFTGIGDQFYVEQKHMFSATLPENFDLLATSKKCKNQVMKHKELPIYSVQFHPEIQPARIIENFINLT